MKLHTIDSRPDANLAEALESFESQFRYPLGTKNWFRVSHGDDYTCFFRSMGNARCFVATHQEQVCGVISASICRLRRPSGEFERAGYLSDLKIANSSRGRTLLSLLRAATEWVLTEPTAGFCVVMDGTGRNPTQYTGRLGIPRFQEVGKLMVLRIPCDDFPPAGDWRWRTSAIESVHSLYASLTADRYATDGGDATVRSEIVPIGLMHPDGVACGIIEDTRRGKWLFLQNGTEMVSAHLSCFGYRSISHAVELLAAAASRCRALEVPALFVSVPRSDAGRIVPRLPVGVVEAPATVFGYDLNPPHGAHPRGQWSINTAEI